MASSMDIFLPSLDQATDAARLLSIVSATFKKFCRVPNIPENILTAPTTAWAVDWSSSGIYEDNPTFAAPVRVLNIITGILKE